MKIAIAHLRSASPYGQNNFYDEPRGDGGKESPADFETRTWRERLHYDDKGIVFIPPMAFKNCITEAARFLGRKIPGRRNATYTKHFEAGVLVLEGLSLGIHKNKVPGQWLFLPSDGVRGSGKRVKKCMPRIDQWEGKVTFHVLDDTITKDVFADHLREAGSFIGLGFFRPRNNGFWGRFTVQSVEWQDEAEKQAAE